MFKSTEVFERAHTCDAYDIRINGTGISKYPGRLRIIPMEQPSAKQHVQSVVHHSKLFQGLIYLVGQKEVYFEDSDMTYPFRQRRYFYYLSGVNEPGCHLIYDIEHDYLTLYIPPISPQTVIWVGRGSTMDEAKDKYDVDAVRLTTSLNDDIYHRINHSPCHQRIFYVLHKDQLPPTLPSFDPPLEIDTWTLITALNRSRAIKSPHEISLIRQAINISSIAHRSILHHITSLRSEAEIHALFLDICISHGAESQAYTPIVASGLNASTLHYTKNNDLLKGRGSVCMDAGCEWKCYSSDITRTFPINETGWASRETENIYQIVQEMQERCIEQLKPGIRYLDLHILAHRVAAKGLIRLGIFKHDVDVDAVIDIGASKAFFPHGLGHHMGLEVHDVSSTPLLGFEQKRRQEFWVDQMAKNVYPKAEDDIDLSCSSHNIRTSTTLSKVDAGLLEENMVLTVEPGIYFSPYALYEIYLPDPAFAQMVDIEILERYMHVGGVRIEDDVLITTEGYENLTLAPKGREMLDIIRDGGKCKHGDDCFLRF
ncbi:hypothetical protein MMC07_006315 [Pseudocyphellaria aurata]|nr:hypothetical protein [Pseudocyphellaria aurata]